MKKNNSDSCFELILHKWMSVIEIKSILKLPYDITQSLEKQSITLSDFYGHWLGINRKLKKLAAEANQVTGFADQLIVSLEGRQYALMNNVAMICSIYLDKRYEFKLTDNERVIAKQTLRKLYGKIKRTTESGDSLAEKSNSSEDSFEKEEAIGLPSAFRDERSTSIVIDKSFDEVIEAYEKIERQHHKNELSVFWNSMKDTHPEMYQLASIIHSIPPTQTTVERSFSVLGYIFDSRRTNLSPELLENTLLINLNKELADKINKRDLDRL